MSDSKCACGALDDMRKGVSASISSTGDIHRVEVCVNKDGGCLRCCKALLERDAEKSMVGAMSAANKYRVKHGVVDAMHYDGEFDLSFLRDDETVEEYGDVTVDQRISAMRTAVVRREGFDDEVCSVCRGWWLVRLGESLTAMPNEKFRATYEEENAR